MKQKNIETTPPSANLIQSGTIIIGNVETNSNLRIDGILKGSVKAEGKVIVGSTGQIEGNVTCNNADIEGKLIGDIKVNDVLLLQNTAHVNGNIFTNKLAIEHGAYFVGKCSM